MSGGDDNRVILWNHRQRKKLHAFKGHLDYIRTCFFHHENPWIVSASDDQTVRIWNWQSRSCLAVLTGHNHYVMCAQFHHSEDLLVSCSLDQTIRVWDISGLKRKSAASHGNRMEESRQLDLFVNDVSVKFVLEGHERGVNWVSFHPTKPQIVSGSDDKQIKIWCYTGSRAWEQESFRGHYNNVSNVLFHPKNNFVISNSEDKSLRIWDLSKKSPTSIFRLDHDRYWTLASHPEIPYLFAAGHDSGFSIFKFEKERPSFSLDNDIFYLVVQKELKSIDMKQGTELPSVDFPSSSNIDSIDVNTAENAILVDFRLENSYSLLSLKDPQKVFHKADGKSPIFLGRNRVASFDQESQIITIRTFKNDSHKEFKVDGTSLQSISKAGPSGILLLSEDHVDLYDMQQDRIVHSLKSIHSSKSLWSTDFSYVVLFTETGFTLATKRLQVKATVSEAIQVRSGYWSEAGVFFYTTNCHLKYALVNGETGVICSLERPLWIAKVSNTKAFLLTADVAVSLKVVNIDPSEYQFKMALEQKNYNLVFKMIKSNKLIGQSIIAYLRRKGYSEIAVQFVKDPLTKFELALECGDLKVGLETAMIMDSLKQWPRLAEEAMLQGNHEIAELCYEKMQAWDKLQMLYLVTGNTKKMKSLMPVIADQGNYALQMQMALLLGDVESQVDIYQQCVQYPLAYATAKNAGLESHQFLEANGKNLEDIKGLKLHGSLKLAKPVNPDSRVWPLVGKIESVLDREYEEVEVNDIHVEPEMPESDAMEEFYEPEEIEDAMHYELESGGWDIDDDDLQMELENIPQEEADAQGVFPSFDTNSREKSIAGSHVALDHILCGSFESAMTLFHKQFGIVNFEPLRQSFMTVYETSRSVVPNSDLIDATRQYLPTSVSVFDASSVRQRLSHSLKLTTGGKFEEALEEFRKVLCSLILMPINTSSYEEFKKLLKTCSQYILGLRLELKRREMSLENAEESKRSVELAAYFSHCSLLPKHLILSLRLAMNQSFKIKNYKTSGIFARRLIEANPPDAYTQQAKKLLSLVEKNPTDAVKLNYDEMIPFSVCGCEMVPIYKGSESISCPFCESVYLPLCKGKLCPNCMLAEIGLPSAGIESML